MVRRTFLSILLSTSLAMAGVSAGTLAPPVQGGYLGFLTKATANPWNASFAGNLGWREVLYEADNPAFAYNFIGMEFVSQALIQELDVGARVVLQPTGFLQTSLAYHRISFPNGLVSMAHGTGASENEIWNLSRGLDAVWADQFTFLGALQKEFGSLQFRVETRWTRINIDDIRDSLYLPAEDLVVESRDDIMGLDVSVGYIFTAPILGAVGPCYSDVLSYEHDLDRQRAGFWFQAWPFSADDGEIKPYWTLRSKVELWSRHSTRAWEPRFELTLGWERNIFQKQKP